MNGQENEAELVVMSVVMIVFRFWESSPDFPGIYSEGSTAC